MNNKSVSSLSLRKLILSAMVAAPMATLPAPLWAALPTVSGNLSSSVGLTSSGGLTDVTTVGNTMNITTPDRSVLTWGSFGVDAGDTINFNLPSTSAAVLNRVNSGATTISGNVYSNGRLFILNGNGIVVSSTGNITASSVVLSTSPESDFVFTATGNLSFAAPATGDVTTAGNIKVGSAGSVTLVGRNVFLAGTIDAGTVSATSVDGGVTLGQVGLGLDVGNATAKYGNVIVKTNGGTANLNSSTATVAVRGGNLTVNTVGSTGAGMVSQTGTGAVSIGNGSDAGSLVIQANSTAGNGTVTLTGVQAASNKTLNASVTAGTTSIVAGGSGTLTLNASTIAGSGTALALTSSGGSIATSGNVVVTGGSINLVASAGNVSFTGLGDLTFGTITQGTGNVVVLSAPTGNITLPSIAGAANVTVTTGAGKSIAQAAGSSIVSTNTATFDAGNAVVLNNAGNDFSAVVIKNSSGGASIIDANNVTLKGGTNAAGNVTIQGANIVLGSAAGDVISVAGALTLSGANISETANAVTVNGALTIDSTGTVTLAGNTGTGVGLANQFGQVNITSTGSATVFEQSTLNLGNISASTLNAYSATSIINNGKISVAGNVMVGAGTASNPGDISLNYAGTGAAGTGNNITGTIYINNDVGLITSGVSTTVGNYLAKNITIANEAATKLVIPANIYGSGLSGNVSITELGSAGIANTGTDADTAIVTTGNLSLTSNGGAIDLSNTNNQFGSVTVTTSGDVTSLKAANAYTLNATLTQKSGDPARSASFYSGGNLTLGSYMSSFGGATTFTVASGKQIVDSLPNISIFGATTFAAPGGVSITKTGHSFGAVTITTTNAAAVLTEAGTLKVASATTGTGALTLTSTSGDIIQTGVITVGNATSTFNAAQGSVVLDQTNSFGNAVRLSAAGNSTIKVGGNVTLGNTTVSAGTLTVDASGGNLSITQQANSTIYVYGDTTFTGSGTGNIVIGNANNRFGGLTLTTGSGNITVKELTTLNLKSVNTTGSLTATSEGGSIIDSGSGTITTGASGATFSAKNDITLGLASNYSSVGFTAGGNVSLADTGDLVLAASTIGGTFRLTNTNSTAQLTQSGALVIAGDTTISLTGGASKITLQNSGNQFGALQFVVGSGGATIAESTTLNLKAGTFASGPVVLSTGGDFVTSGVGSSSFTYTGGAVGTSLQISATGTIIPGAGSLTVLNGMTVFSNAVKNLGALSRSGNLYGKEPINLGSGAYSGPAD